MNAEQMSTALDLIEKIASKVLRESSTPSEIERALRKILSISSGEDRLFERVVHRETHEQASVSYKIEVFRDGAEYWGRWACPLCGQGGVSKESCPSTGKAMSAAKASLSSHPASCSARKPVAP